MKVSPPRFRLRFPESEIPVWAARFPVSTAEAPLLQEVRPAVLARGYATRKEFLAVCEWKTARTRGWCASNTESVVRTITQAAFSTTDEALKMDLLRLLHGVEWPTASSLLHFCDAAPYPILDFRAVWSLGISRPPTYTMDFWLGYLAYTRDLAKSVGLSIRTVDKALWQYSKEKQRVTMDGRKRRST